MGNGLIRKIGKKIILPLAIAGIVGGGCKKYDVEGSVIKFIKWDNIIKEKRGNLEIRYDLSSNADLFKLKVSKYNEGSWDVERYSLSHSDDVEIIDMYQERANSLIFKIDSINKSEKEIEEQRRKDFALKALE